MRNTPHAAPVLLLLAVLAFLPGCGSRPPKMDASTDESVKQSIDKMTEGMTDAQKEEFGKDCLTACFEDMMRLAAERAFSKEEKRKPTKAEVFKAIHGLTAAEIHAKAVELRAKGPPEKKEGPPPVGLNVRSEVDGAGVTVTGVTVGKVEGEGLGGKVEVSKDDLLTLAVRIDTTRTDRRYSYRTWRDSFAVASVADDLNNKYPSARVGFYERYKGGTNSGTVNSEKTITDVLIFEKPVKDAGFLIVTLSGKQLGVQGEFKYRLPLK